MKRNASMTLFLPAVLVILIPLIFFSCTTSMKQPTEKDATKPPLAESYYQAGLQLEQDNHLVEAKERYRLALTSDPSHTQSSRQLDLLNSRLEIMADQHYKTSRVLKKKGKYGEATRHLRMALHLWPEHAAARNDLAAGIPETVEKFIIHIVKKGESLSRVSKHYYGTTTLTQTLAQVNQVQDAAKIRIGMKLKIPQLTDHPFVHQPPAQGPVAEKEDAVQPIHETDSILQDIYIDLGIEFYESKEYKNAIMEFKKALHITPGNKKAIGYLSRSLATLGNTQLARKEYLNAIGLFEEGLSFDASCIPCQEGLLNGLRLYKELHYKTGMKHFDAQDLEQAISEWTLVVDMDPTYKRAAELLEKAKTIRKNIETLKKTQ